MATERDYRMTVSAVLARGTTEAAAAEAVAIWTRAKKKVDDVFSQPVPDVGGKGDPYRTRATQAESAYEQIGRAARKTATEEERAQERALAHVASIRERYFREEQARQEKASREQAARNQKIASDAVGYMRKAAGVATRIAGEVVGGMGVETSLSSLIARGASNETLAGKISGYGYIEGEKGAAGQRQDPKAILADARAAANAAKLDTGEVLEGLAEWTKKSSELELGRQILPDLAKFAKATGANFRDVASAAGDISKKLGDIPNKAEAVKGALSVLNREGKFGAIDFSDLAKVLPTVVGGANQFAQGSAAAISQLGVALQITKSFGGAKNPAQAATSVASFVGDLTSKAGLKSLTAAGIDPFADAGKTKLKSIEEIVVMALEKSGGDLSKMSAMFSNKRSGAVLKGFGQVYTEAEAAQKGSGAQAVRDIFKSYGAQTSKKDLDEAFKVNTSDTASKVTEFNNRMEEVADKLRAGLLPALEKLAPKAIQLAEAFSMIATEAAEHPWAAVGTVIATSVAASIAKAAVGDMAGKALGSALSSLGGKGMAIGALTATAVTAYLYLKKTFDEAAEGQTKGVGTQLEASSAAQLMRDVAAGRISKEDALKKMQETYATGSKQVQLAEQMASGKVSYWDAINPLSDVKAKDVGAAQELIAGEEGGAKVGGQSSLDALKSDLAGLKTAIEGLQKEVSDSKPKGPMDVNIVGGMPAPGPSAPTAGTVSQ